MSRVSAGRGDESPLAVGEITAVDVQKCSRIGLFPTIKVPKYGLFRREMSELSLKLCKILMAFLAGP